MATTTDVAAQNSSRTYTSLAAAAIPLAALCLAFFVEMVDNTLLSIALPTIGRDLGSSTTPRCSGSPARTRSPSVGCCSPRARSRTDSVDDAS